MSDRSLDRRRFLHGLGVTAALGTAGCSGLSLGSEEEPRLAAQALQSLTSDPAPIIPQRLPVDIEGAYLESIATGVRETLETVPTPLTATHVPNGAIREDLTHLREHVETDLEAARDAPSPSEALEEYRRAGSTATELATAWAVIDDGLTRADVAERASAIDQTRSRFEQRWSYVGTDPVTASVLHAALERRVRTATRILAADDADRPDPPDNALTIGEFAGDLYQARAAIEDADYLYRQHTHALTDGDDLQDRLESAAEGLGRAITARKAQLPDVDASDPSTFVDRDISATPAAEVLQDLYRELDRSDSVAEEQAAGRPANAVLAAVWTLAQFRAFDSILEDVTEGASYAIETVDDIGTIRADAVNALTATTEALDASILANQTLDRLSGDLRFADRRLTDRHGAVRVSYIRYEIAQYVEIAAIARALPASVAQAVDALRTGP